MFNEQTMICSIDTDQRVIYRPYVFYNQLMDLRLVILPVSYINDG